MNRLNEDIIKTLELILHLHADAVMIKDALPEELKGSLIIRTSHLETSGLAFPALVTSLNLLKHTGYIFTIGHQNIARVPESDLSQKTKIEKKILSRKALDLIKESFPRLMNNNPEFFGHFGNEPLDEKKLKKVTPEWIEQNLAGIDTVSMMDKVGYDILHFVHIFDFKKTERLLIKLKTGSCFEDIVQPKIFYDEEACTLHYKGNEYVIAKSSTSQKAKYMTFINKHGFDEEYTCNNFIDHAVFETAEQCLNARKKLNSVLKEKSDGLITAFVTKRDNVMQIDPRYLA